MILTVWSPRTNILQECFKNLLPWGSAPTELTSQPKDHKALMEQATDFWALSKHPHGRCDKHTSSTVSPGFAALCSERICISPPSLSQIHTLLLPRKTWVTRDPKRPSSLICSLTGVLGVFRWTSLEFSSGGNPNRNFDWPFGLADVTVICSQLIGYKILSNIGMMQAYPWV